MIMEKKFTKVDLEIAFRAGRARRFDTGLALYDRFVDWYNLKYKKSKTNDRLVRNELI